MSKTAQELLKGKVIKEQEDNFMKEDIGVVSRPIAAKDSMKALNPINFPQAFDLDGTGNGIKTIEELAYYYELLLGIPVSTKASQQIQNFSRTKSFQEIFWGIWFLVKKKGKTRDDFNSYGIGLVGQHTFAAEVDGYFLGLRNDRRRTRESVIREQERAQKAIDGRQLITIVKGNVEQKKKTVKRQEQKQHYEEFTWIVDGKVLTTFAGSDEVIENAADHIKDIIEEEEVKAKRFAPTKYVFKNMPVSENLIPTPLLKQALAAIENSAAEAKYGWTHLKDGRMVDGTVYTLLRKMGREPESIQEYNNSVKMIKRLSAARAAEGL